MRRWVVVLSAFTISAAAATTVVSTASAEEAADPYIRSGGMAGVVPVHGYVGNPHGGSSPNLTYHGGPVLTTTTEVQPIFWGTSWAGYTGDKMTGMDSFYSGLGSTSYMGTNTEYNQTGGQHVSAAVHATAHLTDATTAPARAPKTSEILAEVAKMITNPVANGYYPVYVDSPRGHAGYCAWHSAGTIGSVVVQFAFFFNLDNDPGCDPGSFSGQSQSQGLLALGNVSGHEISEAATDPHLNAWYDSQGYENSDKCAWTFGGPVSLNGRQWLIQGNWSNAAYNGNAGYTDTSSGKKVRGCIDGTH